MKIKLCHMMLVIAGFWSIDLSAYIMSYDQEPISDSVIVPIFNSQGLSWDNDLLYLTYLFKDEIGQITFRTYPFTTINVAGFYRLATNVSNQITISVSNVTL